MIYVQQQLASDLFRENSFLSLQIHLNYSPNMRAPKLFIVYCIIHKYSHCFIWHWVVDVNKGSKFHDFDSFQFTI